MELGQPKSKPDPRKILNAKRTGFILFFWKIFPKEAHQRHSIVLPKTENSKSVGLFQTSSLYVTLLHNFNT